MKKARTILLTPPEVPHNMHNSDRKNGNTINTTKGTKGTDRFSSDDKKKPQKWIVPRIGQYVCAIRRKHNIENMFICDRLHLRGYSCVHNGSNKIYLVYINYEEMNT